MCGSECGKGGNGLRLKIPQQYPLMSLSISVSFPPQALQVVGGHGSSCDLDSSMIILIFIS